jgi:hypothetical protein
LSTPEAAKISRSHLPERANRLTGAENGKSPVRQGFSSGLLVEKLRVPVQRKRFGLSESAFT